MTDCYDGMMLKPRFNIRTFLIAAVLLGFVGIPAGHKQFLKWRQRDEVIPVVYSNAQDLATVLRNVYADQLASQPPSAAEPVSIAADATSNVVIVSGPKKLIREMRNLVSALDAPASTTIKVIDLEKN